MSSLHRHYNDFLDKGYKKRELGIGFGPSIDFYLL